MALTFHDDAHKFFVDFPSPAQEKLEFGTRLFLSCINPIVNVQAIEQAMAAGTPLFGSGLVPAAAHFSAASAHPSA